MDSRLLLAKDIADQSPDEALRLCNDVLNDDFDNDAALFISGYIMMQAERFGLAYNLYKRCAELRPHQSEVWNNLGMCCDDDRPEEALWCFEKALELSPKNHHAMINKALIHLKQGDPSKCVQWCNQALLLDPESIAAKDNRAQARLMLREWGKGWDDYQWSLGGKHRSKRDYGVPEWNGEPGTVVVYREQGLGDEILFMSCLEDLQKTNPVIVDCDKRLQGVFSRSFDCPVYGTGFDRETPLVDEHTIDYQVAMGALPRFYRRKASDFPGKPYLKSDPQRCLQWRALLDTLPGLKIGIAWSGGLRNTGEKGRSISLDDFAPLLSLPHSFISLEYKQPDQSDLDKYGIHHFARAVNKGVDYDDTIALINECDLIISVTTTVIHGAGALGKECWCLVPMHPSFRFHLSGEMPWHQSVKLIRQSKTESWADVLKRVARQVEALDGTTSYLRGLGH
jgi:hypothetical protein